MKKCLYLSVFFIAFFSSCSDNELEEMSNSVPVSKYPQKVIDISMESPESFSHFSNISITRSSELLKDSVWSDGKGHTLIYETNEHVPTQELMRYIYLGSILQGGSIEKQRFVPVLTYIIHSGFISGYQNRYGDNLKPPTNVYHRMTA